MSKINNNNEPKFYVKKLSKNGIIPKRGSKLAAGYDLSSAYNYTIPKRGKKLCKTDIAMVIPSGYYGRVAPRSGLTHKHGLDVGAGVIDADYRGNVGVILFNHTDKDFKVNAGDRIAQLILEKIVTPEITEVDELPKTDRMDKGFGSSGLKKL